VFWEHAIGFVLLIPWLIPEYKKIFSIKPRVWGALGWVTLLSSILGTLFYTAALGKINFIQFSVVVLLQQLQPAFVLFFAWVVLKEKIHKNFFIWFLLALIGAYFVSFPSLTVNLATGGATVAAALLAVGAAFAWGSSTAFSRYALLRLPSVVTTGLRFGLATVLGFVFVVAMGQQGALLTLQGQQWLTILGIALSTGMVAMVIYYYGLAKTPARVSSICELAWPISAVLIDYFGFHRSLTVTQWAGVAVLLLSIYNVSKMAKKV
jgi:drug/metabolite transporter (DMT)-like permease